MSFTIPDNITWKNLEAGVVLLNLGSGAYYTLNETASEIWRELLEGKGAEEIVSVLTEVYEAEPDTLSADVHEQLQFFVEEGLLSMGAD